MKSSPKVLTLLAMLGGALLLGGCGVLPTPPAPPAPAGLPAPPPPPKP